MQALVKWKDLKHFNLPRINIFQKQKAYFSFITLECVTFLNICLILWNSKFHCVYEYFVN